jgi:hypothetical protein
MGHKVDSCNTDLHKLFYTPLNGQRVFDAIVEGDKVILEIKTSQRKLVQIPWEDVVSQVDAAKDISLLR